ncbi:MAG: Gfo/Idh/MocA family protein [Anaerolineae bacterium]
MDKIKVAVIGCGDVAFRHYLPTIQALGDQVEVVAVCDCDGARAAQAREMYEAAVACTSSDEVLALPNLDGVVILTPMETHGRLAIAALESGRHVYVEKVMATSMAEADRMVALAEQKNLVLACAPGTVFLSAYQRTKELLHSGVIGQLCFAYALAAHMGPARWEEFSGDPTWFYQPGAGPLFDLGVYPLHILTQLVGPVKRVTAFSGLAVPELVMTARNVRGQRLRVQVDDTALLLLDFGNAILASIAASYNVLASRLPDMQFWGSKGAMTAPQFLGDEVSIWRAENGRWELIQLPPSALDRFEIAAGLPHWLECIRAGKRPLNDGRHGRHILDILLAAQRSARTGQAITLESSW